MATRLAKTNYGDASAAAEELMFRVRVEGEDGSAACLVHGAMHRHLRVALHGRASMFLGRYSVRAVINPKNES